jgi:hypothetical protein
MRKSGPFANAYRPRGEPPAVEGGVDFTLRQPGGQDKCPFGARRRVGSTELSGGGPWSVRGGAADSRFVGRF